MEPGYYYDLNGHKIEGIINRNYYTPKILGLPSAVFKKDKSSKSLILDPNIYSSFVCGPDSFTVCHTINPDTDKFIYVKVLMDEPIKLYEADKRRYTNYPRGGGEAWGDPHFFYGTDADHSKPMNKKNFKEAMAVILAKRPELLEKINSREYEFDDMENLVNYYNGMRMQEAMNKK